MSKAYLSFNLNNVDDVTNFKRANKALDMALAISNMKEEFRRLLKYTPDSMTDLEIQLIDTLSDKFIEILNEFDINLDELLN